jgi:nucleoid DNA-binding protein
MNKKELIEAIAKKKGKTPESVSCDLSTAYDEIFTEIIEAVADGEVVEIPGFGRFHRREQHLGRTRVPSSKKVPDFSPDFNFKDAVQGGSERGRGL